MDEKKSPGRDLDFDVLTTWGAGVPDTDEVDAPGPSGDLADRASAALHLDPAVGLSVLHVVVQAGPTNSQYNEHCLPVMRDRRITVCSLFPADVAVPREITLVQGDGSVRGCFRALREALALATYDVVHVHAAGSGILALAVYLFSRRSRRDLVFTLHTSWPNVRLRNRLFLYVVAGLFPVFVACGDASAASLPRTLRWLVRRLEVVPNGVDVERIDRVLEGEVVPAPPTGRVGLVVSVGRLIGIKDPATVVAAFRRAARPEDQLVMVGDGELAPEPRAGRAQARRVTDGSSSPVWSRARRSTRPCTAPTCSSRPPRSRGCPWPCWRRWCAAAWSCCPTSPHIARSRAGRRTSSSSRPGTWRGSPTPSAASPTCRLRPGCEPGRSCAAARSSTTACAP